MHQNKFTLFLLLFTTLFYAQKRMITHADYDLWKDIDEVIISNTGQLIVTVIKTATLRGDGTIELYNTQKNIKVFYKNGYDATISHDENFVVFKRKSDYKTIRKEKKEKVKKESKSKDALFIYDVKNGVVCDSILKVKNYKLLKKNSDYLLIEKYKEEKKKDSSKLKSDKHLNQDYLLVYNLKTKDKDTIRQIKDYEITEDGTTLFYTKKNKKKKKKDLGIFQFNLRTGSKIIIDTTQFIYTKLVVSKADNALAYLAKNDTVVEDVTKYELYLYKENRLHKLIDTLKKKLRKNWVLSDDRILRFSEHGKRLYYYSKPNSRLKKNTNLIEDEIPQVDIWHWQDKMIQPEQKAKFKDLQQKAYVSYYDIVNKRHINLQDEIIDAVVFNKNRVQDYILGYNNSPYRIESSWDRPHRRDYFVINTKTGEKQLAIKNTYNRLRLAPDNKYALYFDREKKHWFSLNLETLELKNLTEKLKVGFHDKKYDRPTVAPAYGFGGFDKEGNALVYDEFNIWKLTLNGESEPERLTQKGIRKNVQYRTLRLDEDHRDNASYCNEKLLITSFNTTTKTSGLYVLENNKLVEKIKPDGFLIGRYKKAKKGDVFVYRKENFKTYPDLYLSTNNFKSEQKITRVNLQQKEYKWGAAELFKWKAFDGTKLEGILYKPENFDTSKKYPLITFYYEKRSNELTKYKIPSPSASTVNPSYLVSNDYILFVPDIIYKKGQPGADAYNCIVSGVETLEKTGFIDSNNMALQGQSWGGYQTAYLITVTNKFKAAMAGAPVSNMTSAYGGIRWRTGQSRAWQYEKAQSRIAKNLWEGLDLYVENSPLFGIPKIETPLLIMHNDADGSVPYYQGIELFMGMRRLQKPVWMLVYNDEAHNLKKIKNKQDLSIRMMQFFDHYLKGKPKPEWMVNGIPRTEKGKNLGYQLNKN